MERLILNPIPYSYDYEFMLIYLIYIIASIGFWCLILSELSQIKKLLKEGHKN